MSGKDRIVNERTNRDDGELGSIGIGAMIVFIALILVAAVASTIIIKTAEELQQNAEQTSSDTRQQISGKVAITDLIVTSVADDIGAGSHVATFDVLWRVSSGSTGIYPGDVSYSQALSKHNTCFLNIKASIAMFGKGSNLEVTKTIFALHINFIYSSE